MLRHKKLSGNDFLKLQTSLWNLCGFHQLYQNKGMSNVPLYLTNLKQVNLCKHQSFCRSVRCLADIYQDKFCVVRNRWRSKSEHRHMVFAGVDPFSKISSSQNTFMNMRSHDVDSSSSFICEKTAHKSGNVIIKGVIPHLRHNAKFYSKGEIFSRPSNSVGLRYLSTLSKTAAFNATNFPPVSVKSWRTRNILILYQTVLSSERLFSKDEGDKNDDKIDEVGNVLKDIQSQKNTLKGDPAVKSDPDLKAILDEIKKDFHESSSVKDIKSSSSSDSDSSSSSSSSDDESARKDQNNNSSHMTKTTSQEDEFIYDYRYADDIEDFGFEGDGQEEEERPAKIVPISLTRGCDGVFDLDELLTFLDHLGLENVVTIDVPPEANYCDHMVIGSAKSARHLQYINDEFLWIHKRKKATKDPHLHIEGLTGNDWCAMDLGNIVLHVFYGDARQYYDIESLWTLGPNLDPKCQEQTHDPLALTEEQLFRMESAKMKEDEAMKNKPTVSLTDNKWPDLSDPKLQQEAG